MERKMETPALFTKTIAELAVTKVIETLVNAGIIAEEPMCHVVVMVPSMKDDRDGDYPNYPKYDLEPEILHEISFSDIRLWSRNFRDIARCKTLQLWHGRNDGRTDCIPHLLFPGDTPFWGGVFREGFAVGCSGFKPWIDRMISGMIADMCIGMVRDFFEKHKEEYDELSFLP